MSKDHYVVILDALGHRYSRRPSELIGITDEFTAIDFDCAILLRAAKINENKEANVETTQTKEVTDTVNNNVKYNEKTKIYEGHKSPPGEREKLNLQFAKLGLLQAESVQIKRTGKK